MECETCKAVEEAKAKEHTDENMVIHLANGSDWGNSDYIAALAREVLRLSELLKRCSCGGSHKQGFHFKDCSETKS